MYDLGRLRVLRELAHRGTLARVAEALSYSPSTISQQLAQLEREVGTTLLVPDGRGVRLTPQALVLVEHVERLLVVLDEAAAAVAAAGDELAGTVRVAAFQTALSALVPGLVEHLAGAHPRLRLVVTQLEPEVAVPMLRARDLDLVLTEDYPDRPGPVAADVVVRPLATDELRLVVPRGDRRRLTALADAVWVLEPPGTTARRWAESVCRAAGFEPDVRFEATDLRLHVDLVRRGRCVALLPGLALGDAAGLTSRPLPGRPARTINAVVRAGSEGNPALSAILTELERDGGRVGR